MHKLIAQKETKTIHYSISYFLLPFNEDPFLHGDVKPCMLNL